MKRFVSFLAILTAALFCLSSPLQAQVYPVTRAWDERAEFDYQNWVRFNWNKNFFTQPGPYQGLNLDCADAVYAMRAIFAMENGFPFAINDPSGGNKLISHEMTRWNNLPLEQRKRQFLVYLFLMGSTRSLAQDSFPTAINNSAIKSGNFILTDKEAHHSWTIQSVSNTGVPYLLFGSLPAVNVLFERRYVPTASFMFPKGISSNSQGGFRAFKSPSAMQLPAWQQPGYSLEQYNISSGRWQSDVQSRLALQRESGSERLERLLINVCASGQERITAVRQGLQAQTRLNGACMSAEDYDLYSTPGRDKRFLAAGDELRGAVQSLSSTMSNDNNWITARDLVENRASSNYCPLSIGRGITLRLGDALSRLRNGRLSNNPNDSFESRWGFASPSAQALSCPVY